ncbi:MAG: hypothetical protein LBH03_05015 [Holophagales bacterium]|jgi:hypothetical protein|nr:hypothetical protein [Holophagales bacterium]
MKYNNSNFGRYLMYGAAIAFAAASPALMAQSKSKIGFSGSFVVPTGSLSDFAGPGFSLGASYEKPLSLHNFSQSFSLQYTIFGGRSVNVPGFFSIDYSVKELGINYDLKYYLGEGGSFYVLGGGGLHSFSMSVKGFDNAEDLGTKFGFNIGGGYCYTPNLGFECRYVLCPDPWLQLSLKLQF